MIKEVSIIKINHVLCFKECETIQKYYTFCDEQTVEYWMSTI